MKRLTEFVATLAFCLAVLSPATAADRGTMHLMPEEEWAQAVPEENLGKVRGGFQGLAFSAFLTAFVENRNGDVAGTGGVTNTPPPTVNTDVQNGQVSISSVVGFTGNLSGVFHVVQVPGSFNVVNSTLNVQVAIINVVNGVQIPSLSSIFGQ